MTGLILIGLARCIAMVIVWNDLAKGDTRNTVPGWSPSTRSSRSVLFASSPAFPEGAPAGARHTIRGGGPEQVTMGQIAESVFIYLGLPFLAGMLTRLLLVRQGQGWYERGSFPHLPLTLDRAALHHRGHVLA